MNKGNKITFIIWLCLSGVTSVHADICPSSEIIKERKISRDYEWTIDERRTLEDVLAVEKLYSVRIKNRGEFVACYYSSGSQLLRLDAKPEKERCLVEESEGKWNTVNELESVCEEKDVFQCVFSIKCE